MADRVSSRMRGKLEDLIPGERVRVDTTYAFAIFFFNWRKLRFRNYSVCNVHHMIDFEDGSSLSIPKARVSREQTLQFSPQEDYETREEQTDGDIFFPINQHDPLLDCEIVKVMNTVLVHTENIAQTELPINVYIVKKENVKDDVSSMALEEDESCSQDVAINQDVTITKEVTITQKESLILVAPNPEDQQRNSSVTPIYITSKPVSNDSTPRIPRKRRYCGRREVHQKKITKLVMMIFFSSRMQLMKAWMNPTIKK